MITLKNKYAFEFMNWKAGASPEIRSLACSNLINEALYKAFVAGVEGRPHDKYGAPKHYGKWCKHTWEFFDSYIEVCTKCGWSRPLRKIVLKEVSPPQI